MKPYHCTIAGICLLTLGLVILSCGGNQTTQPSSSTRAAEVWYDGAVESVVWVDIDDDCSRFVPTLRATADSICQARGYRKAAGYDPIDCYASGQKDTYLECVACTNEN